EIQKDMLEIAKVKAKENTINISDYSEFKSKIGKGGFFNADWCGKTECE
ncbi:MAG: proline--tRNA ligase, partial [Nitrosopumilales archaeon CG_4_9_14_0_8_um_filter_34_10]